MSYLDKMCLRLASKGWCNGDPQAISKLPVSWVFKMSGYQAFKQDCEHEIYINSRQQ